MDIHDSFSPAAVEKIDYYVYLLIDPSTSPEQIFYIGKGRGKRIFTHVDEAESEITENAKRERIRAIQERGQQVKYVIHRHGLTEDQALEVEAALIDLIDLVGLPGLTNLVGGYHSRDRGWMTIEEINETYDAPAIIIKEPAIIVTLSRLYHRAMTDEQLYDAARGDWVLGPDRDKAKYVFAVSNRIVRQVYQIERWHPAKSRSEESKQQERWRFDGHIAEDMQHYIGGSVEIYMKMGAQNPIRYINC